MQRVLGFRINILPGAVERKGTPAEFKHPDGYQVQHFDLDNKPKAVRPASKETWDLWCELVRYRIEHDGACKMAWDLYAAATGVTVQSFNGMPAGEPVEHVKAERERLITMVRNMEPIWEAAHQVRESDGSYTTEIAGVVISKAKEVGAGGARTT